MKRIKLIVAYDGTNYHGWQIQSNGLSIEAVLNKALSGLLGEPIAVIGASRTDSGVHALGNVAVFDTENRMPGEKICFALNQRLPEDIRIQSSEEVPLDWHPRKQNCVKTYEYRILNRKIDMPVGRLYTYFCYFPIDVEKMRQGAGYLVGEHDFKSFCTARTQAEETVRTIYRLDVERGADDVVVIRVCGSGFLYNMVRIIAGTLLRVGTGLYGPERVEEILDARNRQAAGPTLPAKGLTLISLEYEQELKPEIKVSNKYWEYLLVQREILPKKKAYLVVYRCADGEFDRLVARMVHQAARNGAEQIYAVDMEGWDKEKDPGSCSRNLTASPRVWEGKRFGYYEMKRSHCYLEMEKEVATKGDRAGEGNESTIAGGYGSEAVKADEKADGKAKGNTKGNTAAAEGKAAATDAVNITPLTQEGREEWIQWYNDCFFGVAGSATYDGGMIESQEKEGSLFFWICAGGKRVGTLALEPGLTGGENRGGGGDNREKEIGIGLIAIKKEFTGLGYGLEALRRAEDYAREKGARKMTLMVADNNGRARRLYEKAGFRPARQRPDFYMAESVFFPAGSGKSSNSPDLPDAIPM